jgi:hypothetical protein
MRLVAMRDGLSRFRPQSISSASNEVLSSLARVPDRLIAEPDCLVSASALTSQVLATPFRESSDDVIQVAMSNCLSQVRHHLVSLKSMILLCVSCLCRAQSDQGTQPAIVGERGFVD